MGSTTAQVISINRALNLLLRTVLVSMMPPRLSITAGPLLLTTRSEAGIGESGDSLPTNPGSAIWATMG